MKNRYLKAIFSSCVCRACWSSGRSHVQNLGNYRCNSPFAGDYAETQADS